MSKKQKRQRLVSTPYYKRLLVFSCTAIVLVGIFLTLIIYMIFNNYTQENITSFESKKTHKAVTQFDDCLTQLASLSFYVSNMKTIPLYELNENNSYWNEKILTDNISTYKLTCQYMRSVTLQDSEINLTVGEPINHEHNLYIGKYRNCSIYIQETAAYPYSIRLLYNEDIPNQRIVSIYTDSSYLSDIVLDENVFVIDNIGTILLSKTMKQQGKNIRDLYPDIDTTKWKTTKDYYVNIENLELSDVSIITISPKEIYSKQLFNSLLISLIISLIMMSLALFLTVRLLKSIYKPIRSIADTFKYHLQTFDNDYEDEFAYINENIEKTLVENEQLSENVSQAIVSVKKAQAQAIYSQISPHFIYNTLDNIKWISIEQLGMDNQVENSIILLNNLIAEALQHNTMITTIEDEMAITDNYIQLMRLRYNNLFDVIIDIDEDVKQAPIIKLSLQPLIENSIIHSFNAKKKGQYVKIRIHRIEAGILVTISDNGCGIPPQKLSELLDDIHSTEPVQNHIGLKNVHLRYKLLYGDAFGIQNIESSTAGTTIKLLLPFS